MPWIRLSAIGLAALATILVAGRAWANGGLIRVSQAPTGPYEVSVYTSPTPLRAGAADVSVLVDRAGSAAVVNDAQVVLTVTNIDNPTDTSRFEATRQNATNKLFYAANVDFRSAGRWRIQTDIRSTLGTGALQFDVDVEEASLFDSLLWPAVVVTAAVGLGIWLVKRHRASTSDIPSVRGDSA